MSFRVEYKRGSTGPAMFQRHVRFQVDISTISTANKVSNPTPGTGNTITDNNKDYLYAITFTLLSGTLVQILEIMVVTFGLNCFRKYKTISSCL